MKYSQTLPQILGRLLHLGPAPSCFALRRIGYAYCMDCRGPHKVDMATFRSIITQAKRLPEEGLHISPRLSTQGFPQLCTYIPWFARTRIIQLDILFSLPHSVWCVWQFLRFHLGVHALPVDMGRRNHIPVHSASVICAVRQWRMSIIL